MARILVLGAYGLIGSAVSRALMRFGHDVIGLGRDEDSALRVLPDITWIIKDIQDLTRRDDWLDLLTGVDFVVNCAGAMQNNPRDRLEVVHLASIGALVLACEQSQVGLIQISAVGADQNSDLEYYRTKAEGDALIREARTTWWIFRPGFVISPQSYGQVSLVRVLASCPMMAPMMLPEAVVQTVSVDDVALAVLRAVNGATPPGTEADLVEDQPHKMGELILTTRRWLGFSSPKWLWYVSDRVVRLSSRLMDFFALLGWRSPMRSASVAIIRRQVEGSAAQTHKVLGRAPLSLEETLQNWPASAEDRLFSRMQLLFPFALVINALVYIWLGLVPLFEYQIGRQILETSGQSPFAAAALVAVLSLVTIVLGVAMFVRKWALRSLWMMILLSVFYLFTASATTPGLWLDPTGPLARVIPMMLLVGMLRLVMDTR